ncbi:Protein-tyrosine-phosphatase MKP1 [Picochlorum sp. SENEW3]|nr:Protein-tyrosine-phosphatase MKP1 [Picochlorum sp. SENEW3]WPT17452.1 Protein-tyrosine-phosphatase MKP1 [Picochlorum sp. SENEW3]
MFPHFTSAFIKKDEDVPISKPREEEGAGRERDGSETEKRHTGVGLRILEDIGNEARSVGGGASCSGASLKQLDLDVLGRGEGPPSEVRNRKEKLSKYERDCTRVGENLFVGGEVVAKSRDILQRCHISHVVNCVGVLYPAYFEDELKYQTLYLQDSPKEDLLAVLYDVFDFIEDARNVGNVFVHCSQGVSRSTSLAIAYRMWREKRQYEDVFAEVKQMRGVANPNIGFICQLIQWHKRRGGHASSSNLYRIAPQSVSAPTYLVPKWMNGHELRGFSLDPRGAFVLQSKRMIYLWRGSEIVADEFMVAAYRFANQLRKYESEDSSTHLEVLKIDQGREPEEFWDSLNSCMEGDRRLSANDTSYCSSFDMDFDIWNRASFSSKASDMLGTDTCDSARSGRKTPRVEAKCASPNDRHRKQARSNMPDNNAEKFSAGNSNGGRIVRSHSPSVLLSARKSSGLSRLGPPPLNLSSPQSKQGDDSCDDNDDAFSSDSGDLFEEYSSSEDDNSEYKSSPEEKTLPKGRMGIPKLNLQ